MITYGIPMQVSGSGYLVPAEKHRPTERDWLEAVWLQMVLDSHIS